MSLTTDVTFGPGANVRVPVMGVIAPFINGHWELVLGGRVG
jgi:hypothetical protein